MADGFATVVFVPRTLRAERVAFDAAWVVAFPPARASAQPQLERVAFGCG